MAVIDGKKISQEIKDEVKAKVEELGKKGIKPCLAVILVGEDPASQVYVRNKKRVCEYCGIRSLSYELPEETTEEELLALVEELNCSKECNGILVQLPLPKHIDEDKVLLKIKPEKDVDGFHPYNVGLLSIGEADLKACTPAGCIELIKRSGVDITGKNCVVVGRSNIVGKPLAILLTRKEYNATVTICHTGTKNLKEITRQADILIAAAGSPGMITGDMIKPGAAVIDVGVNRIPDSTKKSGFRLTGDVKFEEALEVAGCITPVPKGVGPMTIAMLMVNTLESALNFKNKASRQK